ncbi:MAG: hypothetical protein EZS28_043225, partial [Streblomastix strix]
DSYENEGTYEEVCRKNCTEIYGQSLRIGEIEDYSGSGISEERLKKLIARFGPIWAYDYRSGYRYIYYGWHTDSDTTKFLVMYREEISGQYELKLDTVSYNEWTNIDLVDFFAYPLTECTTSSIPQFSCICSKEYFSGECICPTTPEGLTGVSKEKCGCIAEDLRNSCKTCTGSSSDDLECICPTTPEGLVGISKDKCSCIAGDLRNSCKTCTGSSSDDLECICPTTPDGLINIATNKCSCIADDLRLPCKTCKGSSTDDIDCICPTTPEELKNIQKTQCDCVPNDLRDDCKETGKDQAESVNIALSLIVATVMIPALALLF